MGGSRNVLVADGSGVEGLCSVEAGGVGRDAETGVEAGAVAAAGFRAGRSNGPGAELG